MRRRSSVFGTTVASEYCRLTFSGALEIDKQDCSLSVTATVTRLYDGGDIAIRPASRCPGCAGACLWRRPALEAMRISGQGLGLSAGDRVRLNVPARYALLGTLAVYGLPLGGLLIGAAVAAMVDTADPVVLTGAVVGYAGTFAAGGRLRRRIERQMLGRFDVRRLEPGSC